MSIKDKIKANIIKLKGDLLILGVYTLLSVIFTYPAVFSGEYIPGHGDAFQVLWIFWWTKEALLNFTSPTYTDIIYYPIGTFVSNIRLDSLISVPIQIVFGLVNSYKIIWTSSFILSGYGAFLLVRYLTDDAKAAFISGLVFMFCPYRFGHSLGHLFLLASQWIPLYVLYLIRTFLEDKRSNIIYLNIFLVFVALSTNYYFIYITTFTLLYFLYHYLTCQIPLNRDVVKKMLMGFIPSGLVITFFYYPLIKEILFSKSYYLYGGGYVTYSADLLGFFLPSNFHPIFGHIVAPIYQNFTGNAAEFTVFAGYTVIVLSALAIIRIKTDEIRFWAISAIIFFIFCLGPILHINGIYSFFIEGREVYIPLPYAILMQIPVFSLARVPSRWDIMLMLSLAVLCGYGLRYIFNIIQSNKNNKMYNANLAMILISCLILFEFLFVPYSILSSTEVPAFYEKIASDDEDYAIFEVPTVLPVTHVKYMYYQTVHGKKIFGGYVPRQQPYPVEFTRSIPFVGDLIRFSTSENDIFDQNEVISDYIITCGASTDMPIAGAWNGDGKDRIGYYRPSTQTWSFDYDNDCLGDYSFVWGLDGDIPVSGDWNGDGKDTAGYFRPSTRTWYFDYDNDGLGDYSFVWGLDGDIPVAGDWNGDGKDTAGLFRPSTGTWYFNNDNAGSSDYSFVWGLNGDIPFVGDWNGDGKDSAGLFRPSTGTWYFNYDNAGLSELSFKWGLNSDIPFVGDWNGNGKDSAGLFRPSMGTWYFNYNNSSPTTDIGSSVLNYYNVKYLILHKDYLKREQLDFAIDLIQKSMPNEEPIYSDDTLIVYEVKDKEPRSFKQLGEGWSWLESWNGVPTRWQSGSSTLIAYSESVREAELRLGASSFYRPRDLEIFVNDILHMRSEVPDARISPLEVPIKLDKGTNIIRFHVPDGCERPSDIIELKNPDKRCLSIAIQNITLS
jgi:hypothetical protein